MTGERVTVHVDGGARGNPGPAAIAAVVYDASGAVLAEEGVPIGEATNNVAEYRAVLLGLRLARELGARGVEVVGDSSSLRARSAASTRSSTRACARCTAR